MSQFIRSATFERLRSFAGLRSPHSSAPHSAAFCGGKPQFPQRESQSSAERLCSQGHQCSVRIPAGWLQPTLEFGVPSCEALRQNPDCRVKAQHAPLRKTSLSRQFTTFRRSIFPVESGIDQDVWCPQPRPIEGLPTSSNELLARSKQSRKQMAEAEPLPEEAASPGHRRSMTDGVRASASVWGGRGRRVGGPPGRLLSPAIRTAACCCCSNVARTSATVVAPRCGRTSVAVNKVLDRRFGTGLGWKV
eukprot:3680131-Prymnesium_polylepis.2